jgi:HEAT repeat protein
MSAKFAMLGCLLAISGCGPSRPPPAVDVPPPAHAPAPPPPAPVVLNVPLHQQALRVLLTCADSDDAHLRADSIEALQETGQPEAAAAAIKGLDDSAASVQFAACVAVGELRLERAHDQLLRLHDGQSPVTVRVSVLFALHRLGDTRYSHELEKLAADPSAEVRGKTAMVLGLLQEPSAIPMLLELRRDAEEPVRLEAATSLWCLGDERGLDDLAAAAVSQYPDDLILATLALAAPKNPRIIQHVRANLVTDYPEVELAAARAMGMLGSDEGYVIAMRGAQSSDPFQRSMAALALGSIGRSDSQRTLAKLLIDPIPSVRLSAATAILQLHDPDANQQ